MATSAWYDHQVTAFVVLIVTLTIYPVGIVVLLIQQRQARRHKSTGQPRSDETGSREDISQSTVDRFRTQQLTRFAREHKLTGRETDVCAHLTRGHTVKAIAEDLCISENTVWTHIRSVYSKCAVNTKQDLIKLFDEQTYI